ncbi:organic solvent tolerance protein [Bdellovibrio bacteriovorus]|uniref:organic solvent tolerance protein n=1 Tax=Bdellovibrio bacteriovorus TaxID=959 RepID=UPI0021D39683|nr:organic solvent tolerance protein [Bdellovibrio bacteriovorus]UXR63724.1 organic solvent tolerance protein [Bdellovibrio bacteriovorus]
MLKKMALALCLMTVGFTVQGQAKELTNRLGVGVKSHSALNLPQLAATYYFAPDMALAGGLGVDTQKDYSKFAFNAGIRRVVFKEDNMNFYMGGSVGVLNEEIAGNKESGFELNALFGGEFFFTGLDSLAFTFEGGVGVVSMDNVRFRTIADSPFSAGIIFYF